MFICLSFGCAGGLKENIGHLDILCGWLMCGTCVGGHCSWNRGRLTKLRH